LLPHFTNREDRQMLEIILKIEVIVMIVMLITSEVVG